MNSFGMVVPTNKTEIFEIQLRIVTNCVARIDRRADFLKAVV